MDLAKYNENAFPAMPIYFDDHGTRKKFEQAIKLALQPAAHQPAAKQGGQDLSQTGRGLLLVSGLSFVGADAPADRGLDLLYAPDAGGGW